MQKCASECVKTLKEEAEVCEREKEAERIEDYHNCYMYCQNTIHKWHILGIRACRKTCDDKFGAPEHHSQEATLDNTLDNFYYPAAFSAEDASFMSI